MSNCKIQILREHRPGYYLFSESTDRVLFWKMRTQTGRMAPGDQESTSGRNGLEDEDDETDEGLFHHLVTSGCWRLFPLILLTVSSKFESSGSSCSETGSKNLDTSACM